MLVELAIDVIQDRAAALYWLKTPKRDLKGKVPLDFVQTQIGIDEVKMLLMRIQKGLTKINAKLAMSYSVFLLA